MNFLLAAITILSFNYDNLAGNYHISHNLVRDRYARLALTRDAKFNLVTYFQGFPDASCSGTYDLRKVYDDSDGIPGEMTILSGSCHNAEMDGSIVVYLKNKSLDDLRRGTYVKVDLKFGGQQMNNVLVKIKKL